jgi:hypothetical protein
MKTKSTVDVNKYILNKMDEKRDELSLTRTDVIGNMIDGFKIEDLELLKKFYEKNNLTAKDVKNKEHLTKIYIRVTDDIRAKIDEFLTVISLNTVLNTLFLKFILETKSNIKKIDKVGV